MNDEHTLPIKPVLVEIDETDQWNLNEEPEILAIKGLWMYDANNQTYAASTVAMFEAHPIEAYPIFKAEYRMTERRKDELQEMVQSEWRNDGSKYIQVGYAESLRPRLTFGPGDYCYEEKPYSEMSYEKQIEEYLTHFRDNGYILDDMENADDDTA